MKATKRICLAEEWPVIQACISKIFPGETGVLGSKITLDFSYHPEENPDGMVPEITLEKP